MQAAARGSKKGQGGPEFGATRKVRLWEWARWSRDTEGRTGGTSEGDEVAQKPTWPEKREPVPAGQLSPVQTLS